MKAADDQLRARYLELIRELQDHILLARNYAMKPGNAWLARSELARANSLISDAEALLEEIKQADQAG